MPLLGGEQAEALGPEEPFGAPVVQSPAGIPVSASAGDALRRMQEAYLKRRGLAEDRGASGTCIGKFCIF